MPRPLSGHQASCTLMAAKTSSALSQPSTAQQFWSLGGGEGASRKPWGERVPTCSTPCSPSLGSAVFSPRGSCGLGKAVAGVVGDPRHSDTAWG